MSHTWFFLRGLVRESGHWSGFAEKFAAAFPASRVELLDLPGAGSRFRESCPFTVSGMVDSIRPEFLARKSEQNFVFALSLGGMVAAEWMKLYPGDFAGGIFLNTSYAGFSPFYRRLQPGIYPSVLRLFSSAGARKREEKILQITSNVSTRHSQLAAEWERIALERPVSRGNAVRQLIAAARFRPPPEAPSQRLLLLNSAGDHLCHPSCSEAISARWKLPLRTHPTAGHDLTLDAPDWVIEQTREYFDL